MYELGLQVIYIYVCIYTKPLSLILNMIMTVSNK